MLRIKLQIPKEFELFKRPSHKLTPNEMKDFMDYLEKAKKDGWI